MKNKRHPSGEMRWRMIASAPSVVAAAFVLIMESPTVHAAGAMVTDDARMVDAGRCQLETWIKKDRSQTEYWALPACNPTGSLELTLGGARLDASVETDTTDLVLQGKALFRTLAANSWGIGLAVGAIRHSATNHIDPYAYVPASLSIADDRVVLHANLGGLREQATDRDRLTWGLGAEAALSGKTMLVGECYGVDSDRPFYQLGLFQEVASRLQFAAIYGNRWRRGTDEHWYSIGLSVFW